MAEYRIAPEEDVVVSARVRLARNYADLPFPAMLTPEFAEEAIRRAVAALPQETYALRRMHDADASEKQYLVEQRLIAPDMSDLSAALISSGKTVSVLVNEEDHLRIQAMLPGEQLERAANLAFGCDDALSKGASFAFDRQLGYLTSAPTNAGTGMRASVLLHLPALASTGQIGAVAQASGKMALSLRPCAGDPARAAGRLFLLSNQVALGRSEEDLIHTISDAALEIASRERMARASLLEKDAELLTDRLMRSAGLMSQVRLLPEKEWYGRYSDLRFAAEASMIDAPLAMLDEMYRNLQSASLQRTAGREMTPREENALRADILRERVKAFLRGAQTENSEE